MDTVKIPAAPTPVTMRPAINAAKSPENAEMRTPKAKIMVETKIQTRGENIWASLPARGEVLDMAIRYADVNQLVFSKASSSAAIVDWVVVRREMFVA